MVTEKKASFVGSSFSCVDILTVLYNGIMNVSPSSFNERDRDSFILSKGHAASALYAVLAERGFFSKEKLKDFCNEKYAMGVHPSRGGVPGIDCSTGSLGNGLSVGCGMALANRIINSTAKTYVLLGDGECNEGVIWEAAMFAPRHNLDSLIAIVDRNMLQSCADDLKVLNMGDLSEKFRAFGWNTANINGHNYEAIEKVLKEANEPSGKPTMIIANTIKGKGVSFVENKVVWHYKWPDAEQFNLGLEELGI